MERISPSALCFIATVTLAAYLILARVLVPVIVLGWPISYSHEENIWNLICTGFTILGLCTTTVLKKKGM